MARMGPEDPPTTRRPLLLGVAVLIALAIVALASRAHTPVGGGGSTIRRVNSELLFEYVVLLTFAAALVILPFVVRSFFDIRPGKKLPERRRWVSRGFATLVVFAVIIGGFATLRLLWGGSNGEAPFGGGAGGLSGFLGRRDTQGEAISFDWLPVIVVGSLLAVGGLIAWSVLYRQKKARRRSPDAIAAHLSDVLDDTLDDLRAESDPRRAVIAAYARMERALAWFGVPRHVFEAPLEYLARVLAQLHASTESVRRLTDLFERAKFSPHEIGPALKEDAIAALVAVRDELRAYR